MTEKRKRPSSALLCTSACKTSFSEELCERDSGAGREQGVRQGKQEQGEITFAAQQYGRGGRENDDEARSRMAAVIDERRRSRV